MDQNAVSGADRQLDWSRGYLRRVKRWRFLRRALLIGLASFTLGLCIYTATTSGLLALPVSGSGVSGSLFDSSSVSLPPTQSVSEPENVDPAPGEYTVFFDARGGTMEASSVLVTAGERVTEPDAPSREGYTFAGWFADAARSVAWDFTQNPVIRDTTLYARWDAVPAQDTALPQTGVQSHFALWGVVLTVALLTAALLAGILLKRELE